MNRAKIFVAVVVLASALSAALALLPDRVGGRDEPANAQRQIETSARDPEWQRLKRLDQTPGTGGFLVNEAEVLPPLDPKAVTGLGRYYTPPPQSAEPYHDPALTEYDVKGIVRKEIAHDRLEHAVRFGDEIEP